MIDFPIDFRSIRRSRRPNECLALPPGFGGQREPDIVSPVFTADAETLRRMFDRAIADEPRIQVVRESPDGLQVELIERSRWLKFEDRIIAGFHPSAGDRSAPLLWSRSETGFYDFGVNRARVVRWLDRLQDVAGRRGTQS